MGLALQPRGGLLGAWDRLVGPGMTRGESSLVLAAGLVGSFGAAARLAAIGNAAWAIALGALLAFDVIGGAVCNATQTTKAWYARPGRARRSIVFIAPHLAYVALVAGVWRAGAFDHVFFAVVGGALVIAAGLVAVAPRHLKRPVAFAVYLVTLMLVLLGPGLTHGLEWFAPALLLKLLVGHFVPPDSP